MGFQMAEKNANRQTHIFVFISRDEIGIRRKKNIKQHRKEIINKNIEIFKSTESKEILKFRKSATTVKPFFRWDLFFMFLLKCVFIGF